MFWYFKHKTLNTDIWNYFKMNRYFECEIKTTSRWQWVTVNKWVIVIEPNHLNEWFIQERITVMLLRDTKQCCDCVWNYLNNKKYFKCEIKTSSRWQQATVNKWVIATEPNHLNEWFIQERITVMMLRDTKQCCDCVWNYLNNKKYFKCEIKTASRWQQVTVNKRVIVIEPNHLNEWFIQERITVMLLRDTKQCCGCVWNYLNNKKYFKCEIKTSSRWQRVTVNKWVIVIEPNHLNESFIQERITIMLLRDTKQCCSCVWNYLNNKKYFKCEIKTSSRWQRVTVNKWVIVIEPNHLNEWFIQERITVMMLRDTKQCCDCVWNYLNNKKYFKCEIKTSSRWQRVTVNKWVIVIEPNHLNEWFIQERITVMLLRDTKQCCSCVWNYLNNKKYFKCEIKTSSRWQRVTVNKWVIVIEPNHLNEWFIQERITIMLLRDTKQCCDCVWNYLNNKKYFKCEIKTASRWQQVTVNKRVIVIEPNHLNEWFIQERITVMLLRDTKQCCGCVWNYLNNKKYFKCEIKTSSRWQQATVNKWVIATEPNHLNEWFIQERITVMLLRDTKQCCDCVWNNFCRRNGAKPGNIVSKT